MRSDTLNVNSGKYGGRVDNVVFVVDAAAVNISAKDSGKTHVIPDLTADSTFTLPTEEVGLNYEFWYGGTAAALGATPALFRGGEEEAPMPMAIPSQTRGVGPPSVLPSALERSESARQRWMKNLQTATTYGGILGAIDPDKKESFNKDISEAMKQMSAYTQDIELSKITDVALKAGQTPRERYMAMIREGATPEEAALVSGHQVELMKAEQTSMGAKAQVWDQIMQTLMAGDTQTAALMLVQAWGTNQLGGAPMSENLQVRMEAATALLTGIASGETSPTAPGAGSGITDISLA